MTEEKYMPYVGRDGACKYDKTTTPPAATVSGFVKLPENNYTALMNAIATIGPIAISVEADTWSFYGGGIFPANKCNLKNTDIDHAVQLVGYGSEGGNDYW
jgi:cathepsin L